MQKTFTVDCFTHKKVKNTGQKPQYLLKGGIPAIIPKNIWLMVQELLKERRSSHRLTGKPNVGIFISRVKTDALRGFVYINPNWNRKQIDFVLKKLEEEKEHKNV